MAFAISFFITIFEEGSVEERGTRNNALQVLRVESAYKKEFKYIKGYNCFFQQKIFSLFLRTFLWLLLIRFFHTHRTV